MSEPWFLRVPLQTSVIFPSREARPLGKRSKDAVKDKVTAWLYSIPRKYIALDSLKIRLIEWDRHRPDAPAAGVSKLNAIFVTGGQHDSEEEMYVLTMEEWESRRQVLVEAIERLEQTLMLYERTLEELGRDKHNGTTMVQLVNLKYHRKLRDSEIWPQLYISKRTFYYLRHRTVKIFHECLPGMF